MSNSRPKFEPRPCSISSVPLQNGWLPLVSCPADFPVEIFEIAISQLIHHPEYNSSLILRSDVISESSSEFDLYIPTFEALAKIRCIRRRLLPRRPRRDPAMEQYCTLYGTANNETLIADTLVLSPIVAPGLTLPYYHPEVAHIAFRYFSSDDPPTLRIEAIPLSGTPTDLNSRLYRTSLSLLDTLHRYGWGALTDYKKRVVHDCLIPREEYQDLYLVMRERHKHLIDTWQEVTDPLKHVFEDIGIAVFLMLMWKKTFISDNIHIDNHDYSTEPWIFWPQPPGGFLDLGCGNGLLTHILISEGYKGYGIDLRARTSWASYPDSTKAALRVHAFDPTQLRENDLSQSYFKRGAFIIGNHADELTPWVPVLSTFFESSGYISIPCCPWAFDSKYERSSTQNYPLPHADFAESLNLGGQGSNKSSYSMYRIWLASLSLHCGWEVECESLRIPSTRNWTIVGRRRLSSMSNEEAKMNVEKIIKGVRDGGLFKARKPEGKAGNH